MFARAYETALPGLDPVPRLCNPADRLRVAGHALYVGRRPGLEPSGPHVLLFWSREESSAVEKRLIVAHAGNERQSPDSCQATTTVSKFHGCGDVHLSVVPLDPACLVINFLLALHTCNGHELYAYNCEQSRYQRVHALGPQTPLVRAAPLLRN